MVHVWTELMGMTAVAPKDSGSMKGAVLVKVCVHIIWDRPCSSVGMLHVWADLVGMITVALQEISEMKGTECAKVWVKLLMS